LPSTHLCLHYHLVFSTKGRRPLIESHWRAPLHAYLGGIVRSLGGVPQAVGGTADHVHLLVGLHATHRLADILREVKGGSSEWMRGEVGAREFGWQEGYGAFTVSRSHLIEVSRYIADQEEHHRKRTFQEEYLALLAEHEIEYDERYLW
jgi:REP element-mobilizing transposase RayT